MANVTTESGTKIYAESASIHDLFSGYKEIAVPHYQRSFSWTDDEVGELWKDLVPLFSSPTRTYFIGSMVFVGPRGGNVEVVDGQQRLTWVSLLLCALRDGCNTVGDKERAVLLNERYLGTRAFRSLELSPKVNLNEENNILFQELLGAKYSVSDIQAILRKREISSSNRLLLEGYIQLYNLLREYTSGFTDVSLLSNIEEAIAGQVEVIRIESPSDVSAYVLFETLNNRGLTLNLADLLKNLLFSMAGSKIDEAKTAWQEIAVLIGREFMPQFIRHEWMSQYGKIRERELYGKIKDSVTSESQALQYLKNLRRRAQIYSDLQNPASELYQELPVGAKRQLEAIRIIGLRQCYPLLLASYESLPVLEFEIVAKWITDLAMRYTIFGEKGTGNLETLYASSSVMVRRKPYKRGDVKDVFEQLWPSDNEFEVAFTEKTLSKADLVKYVLGTIERSRGRSELMPDFDALSVEHILPKKPDTAEWDEPTSKDPLHKQLLRRIGNLTLLTQPMNKDCENRGFVFKKTIYKDSDLGITQDLLTFSGWGKRSIEERQANLAKEAVKVWNMKH